MSLQYESWQPITPVWDAFIARHPELGLKAGKWAVVNVLRRDEARLALIEADCIRRATGRHWIAQPERFEETMFALLTGGPLRRINEREVAR